MPSDEASHKLETWRKQAGTKQMFAVRRGRGDNKIIIAVNVYWLFTMCQALS